MVETVNQVIYRLRSQGKTFPQISNILSVDYGVNLTPDAVGHRYNRMIKRPNNLVGSKEETIAAQPQEEITSSPGISATPISEKELRSKHDMFFIVSRYLEKIPAGSFIEENMMLKELNFYGKPRSKYVLSRDEIKQYRGRVDGVTYYGHPDSINKLKREGVLQ